MEHAIKGQFILKKLLPLTDRLRKECSIYRLFNTLIPCINLSLLKINVSYLGESPYLLQFEVCRSSRMPATVNICPRNCWCANEYVSDCEIKCTFLRKWKLENCCSEPRRGCHGNLLIHRTFRVAHSDAGRKKSFDAVCDFQCIPSPPNRGQLNPHTNFHPTGAGLGKPNCRSLHC